ADRDVVAPDPDALEDEIGQRDEEKKREQAAEAEAGVPAERRLLRENDRADLVGDGAERVAGRDHRRRRGADVGAVRILDGLEAVGHVMHPAPYSRSAPPPDTSSSAGC